MMSKDSWYDLSTEPLFHYFEKGWTRIREFYSDFGRLPVVTYQGPAVMQSTREMFERYDVEAGMRSCMYHLEKFRRGELV